MGESLLLLGLSRPVSNAYDVSNEAGAELGGPEADVYNGSNEAVPNGSREGLPTTLSSP